MRSVRASAGSGLACMLGLLLVMVGCGGGGDDETSGSASSIAPAAGASTSLLPESPSASSIAPDATIAPMTFPEALVVRLGDELGDAALAAEVVAQMDDAVIARLDEVTDGDAADPLLTYTPSNVAPEKVDSVVVFAFGNRLDAEGTHLSGPTNLALAETTAAFVADHPVPVYAQWEVAETLDEEGVPGVVSIDPDVDASGQLVYLSTAGVADKAVVLAEAHGVDLGHVGIIAFEDHAMRSIMTARDAGMTADVPAGVVLPSTYDPESGQPWTRDRVTFVGADLAGRLLATG